MGSVLSTPGQPPASGPAGFASEMPCGAAVLEVISLALGEPRQAIGHWPAQPAAMLARLYLMVLESLMAFSTALYWRAHAVPAVAASDALATPWVALFLGALFAEAHGNGGEWTACGVIFTGVFLIFRGKSAT